MSMPIEVMNTRRRHLKQYTSNLREAIQMLMNVNGEVTCTAIDVLGAEANSAEEELEGIEYLLRKWECEVSNWDIEAPPTVPFIAPTIALMSESQIREELDVRYQQLKAWDDYPNIKGASQGMEYDFLQMRVEALGRALANRGE